MPFEGTMQPLMRSFKTLPPGRQIGDVDRTGTIRLMIVFRPALALTPVYEKSAGLSRAQYVERYSTPLQPMEALADYARQHGLQVTNMDPGKHTIELRGTFGQACDAFQPDYSGVFDHNGRTFEARWGHLYVPAAVHSYITGVLGFDSRASAKSHLGSGYSSATAYDPTDVAARYGFPLNAVDGTGQTIAFIALGGGYLDSDLNAYFGSSRSGTIECVPPEANQPRSDTQAWIETMLEICIIGKVATGANIVAYFGDRDPSDREHVGFLKAIMAAVQDGDRNPSVLCITWGSAEVGWDSAAIDSFEQVFQTAKELNITVCAASGDKGALDDSSDGQNSTDYPAASPLVVACGGTSLPRAGIETGWSQSGGGFSRTRGVPQYQIGVANIPGNWRGVPDVAGNADLGTGFRILVDGIEQIGYGTSAAAPMWAALVSLMNQQASTRIGFLNPLLYRHATEFNDIVDGNNGYSCATGWDPVTGLGTPTASLIAAISAEFPVE